MPSELHPERARVVRFDEAFGRARAILSEYGARGACARFVLIRDVQGRLSVLTDAQDRDLIGSLADALSRELGAFGGAPEEVLLSPSDFFDPEAIFTSPDARLLFEPRAFVGPTNVLLLERSITGLDWMRPPLVLPSGQGDREARRLTFFGLKGGVGRSTALTLSARALARGGARVLVVDLDLESPGLNALLLPEARTPTFGVVDYLVEEGLGQDDDELLSEMVATSPIADDAPGEILVVPAGGSQGDYLAKLGRVYQPALSGGAVRDLAERMDRMLSRAAERARADVVLLDSRAGLHDLAASAVTRLRADSLLFAVASEQTFRGYRLLFQDWCAHPNLVAFRDRLRMVAALVPETGREDYARRFVESSHDLFASTIYEKDQGAEQAYDDAAGAMDVFNFSLHDPDGPHFPWMLYWNRALQEFDPVKRPSAVPDDQVQAAAGAFCRTVGALLEREVVP